jgi:DNA-binding PadR family transcriptional regulator
MKEDFDKFLSPSPAALHILLAIVSEDRHGYGIMQKMARQSDDRYKLGPGRLYDNLEKLLSQGGVEEAARPSLADDPRRRYYRLTRFGRRLLATEIMRLEGVTMKRMFRFLLWLHPAAFRQRFEEEMLWIFDEAADSCGGVSLFSDATVSLVRQWLLRSGLWIWARASPESSR